MSDPSSTTVELLAGTETAAAAEPTTSTTPPPFHVLMEDDCSSNRKSIDTLNQQQQRRRRIRDRRLENDYLSRRFRAFQDAQPITTTATTLTDVSSEDDTFWKGASPLERSLVACCCSGTTRDREGWMSSNGEDHGCGTDTAAAASCDEQEHTPGALARDQIVRFVGLVALHCHTTPSRALALAILERTQEADDWELETTNNSKVQSDKEASESSSVSSSEPPTKRRRLSRKDDDDESSEYSRDSEEDADANISTPGNHVDERPIVHSMSPTLVRVQRKMQPSRLKLFLNAGGLRILSRWLMECATPVPASHLSKTTSRGALVAATGGRPPEQRLEDTTMVASPTGPLLLPLLLFLQKLPFDLQAIKESRINKRIKTLSKSLDTILPPPAPHEQESSSSSPGRKDSTAAVVPSIVDTRTDPAAGGLNVAKVQDAVNNVKKIWEEQATKAKQDTSKRSSKGDEVADPFAAFKSILEDRLKDLAKYEGAMDTKEPSPVEELPRWLAKVREARFKKLAAAPRAAGGKNASHKTTEEMARREREIDARNRALLSKKYIEDLAKAQHERRELLAKLRARKQHTEPVAAAARQRQLYVAPTKRGVRWKDGLGQGSTTRNREDLEEVFVFVRDKDVLAAAVAAEGEEDGGNGASVAGNDASADGHDEGSQSQSASSNDDLNGPSGGDLYDSVDYTGIL